MSVRKGTPFREEHELCHELALCSGEASDITLPGRPTLRMADTGGMLGFLCQEYCVTDLDSVSSKLWTLTTPSSTNIPALHSQRVRGRDIVITEDPRLHLLWIGNRIFVKPLPVYLLSYTFWNEYLLPLTFLPGAQQQEICKAALGYLRTYRFLIKHESDFRIAKAEHLQLVPKHVTWPQMCYFLDDLKCIDDDMVSGRYHYGTIRLSRLNLYAPLLFGRWLYEYMPFQYGEFFTRLYGPVLFIFAVVSTMLNCMQVTATADGTPKSSPAWLWRVFHWSSILMLLTTILVTCALIGMWAGIVADEWRYSITTIRRKRREGKVIGTKALSDEQAC